MNVTEKEAMAIVNQFMETDQSRHEVDLTSPRVRYVHFRKFLDELRKRDPQMIAGLKGRDYWEIEYPYVNKHYLQPDGLILRVDCLSGKVQCIRYT